MILIDRDGEFFVFLGFVHFDSLSGGRDLGAQVDVGGGEHVIGSQSFGFFDDDGELGGEAAGEFEEGRREIRLDLLWDDIAGDGFEEDHGGGDGGRRRQDFIGRG